jgi:hypothetical protein
VRDTGSTTVATKKEDCSSSGSPDRYCQGPFSHSAPAAQTDQAPWGSTYRQIITKWMALAVTTMMWNTS